jgi:hypothetical protein
MPVNVNPQQRSNLVLFFLGVCGLLSYNVVWAADCVWGYDDHW